WRASGHSDLTTSRNPSKVLRGAPLAPRYTLSTESKISGWRASGHSDLTTSQNSSKVLRGAPLAPRYTLLTQSKISDFMIRYSSPFYQKKIFKPNKLLGNANFHFSKLELNPNGMIPIVLPKESGPSQATERPALTPCGLKLQKSHLNRIF
ncbi:hypothetical protein CFP56_027908, partial [Quercus suber]